MNTLNPDVTALIESQKHPLAGAITRLRKVVLSADPSLSENIKWNGPNYAVGERDRITIRTQPPTLKALQIIFHRGAKNQAQPESHLIEDPDGLLVWKENDRAILSIKSEDDVTRLEDRIVGYVRAWLKATT